MTQGIYVSAMTPQSGKSLVALGLADSLFRKTDRLGYFRPVLRNSESARPRATSDLPDCGVMALT